MKRIRFSSVGRWSVIAVTAVCLAVVATVATVTVLQATSNVNAASIPAVEIGATAPAQGSTGMMQEGATDGNGSATPGVHSDDGSTPADALAPGATVTSCGPAAGSLGSASDGWQGSQGQGGKRMVVRGELRVESGCLVPETPGNSK